MPDRVSARRIAGADFSTGGGVDGKAADKRLVPALEKLGTN
jgi:hypothetical protein